MQTLKLTKKYEKYPEYKDSGVEWFGKAPKEWQVVRGKTIFESKKELNKGMKNNNVLSLTMNGVINRDHENNEGLLPSDYQTFQIFDKDDLVFKLIDLENYKTSRVGLVHEKGIMSPVYLRLIAKNKKINQKYYYYLYYHLYIQGIYNFLGSGVRSALSVTDLLEINLLVPDFQEQNRIVKSLDEKLTLVNSVIERKIKLIELLKERRSYAINKTLIRGLNPNVKMVDTGVELIGEIPQGWKVEKLKFLAKTPLQYGANESALDDDISKPRYIRISDINEHGNLRDDTFKSLDIDIAKPYILKEGDILFTRTGATVGKTFRYKKEWGVCCYAGYLIRMSVNNKKISSEYLENITKSSYYWKWISSIFIQSTIQNVSAEKYKELRVVFPSITEQKEICEYLNDKLKKYDEVINCENDSIKKLKELKNSFISDMVTGKIKV